MNNSSNTLSETVLYRCTGTLSKTSLIDFIYIFPNTILFGIFRENGKWFCGITGIVYYQMHDARRRT